MVNLNKRLFDLLYESRRTQKDLADAIGISERNISSWKARGSDPPSACIMAISQFFGISAECFLTGEEHSSTTNVVGGNVTGGTVVQGSHSSRITIGGGKNPLTDEEAEILRLFQSLDVRRRVKLFEFGFTLEEDAKSEKTE